jgi:N-acyl-D-aspartate/D-glutamate deacylase
VGKLVLRDPTVSSDIATTLSPRLPELAGKTIGAIWNGRPPGDALLSDMLDVLVREHGVIRGPLRRKPFLGNVAPDDLLTEMAATCDAVVTGVGD